jgi:cell wall-associated NlpC family hydrolase
MAPDPKVIQGIRKAAKAAGADPAALLATALTESGARLGAVGDQASGHPSYGPWQMRSQVGALGSHSPAWANSYAAALNRAQEFKRLGVHGGKGAAAVQRPADPSGYALKVQANLAEARRLLGSAAPRVPVPGRQAQPTAPAFEQPDLVGNSLIQSILSQNAELAGIPEIQLPVATPIAPRAKPAPVKVEKSAQGTGAVPSTGAAIVEVARKYLGTKYVWGGANPKTGFDCSGLLQWAAAQSGIKIPRTTYQQVKAGKPVAPNQLQPGDAVFFANRGDVHHVGIYVGAGKFIQAPRTGDVVKISTLADRKDFVAARRYA